jgi:hypothetical protein
MIGQPAHDRAPRRFLAASLLAVTPLTACALGASPPPADPLSVVQEWVEARDAGDIEVAMALLADEGDIFGIGIHLPGALYTTPEGARAVLDLLDEYEAAAGS